MRLDKRKLDYSPLSVIINLLAVYVCYEICRIVFVMENWSIYHSSLNLPLVLKMSVGGLRFDTAAIMYTNIPYLLLVLLPLHYKETKVMRAITKWIFVIVNSLCIIINLIDCVYFAFTQRRTTIAILDEFGGNTNIGSIIGIEALHHWYLILVAAVLIYFLICAYRPSLGIKPGEGLKSYYLRQAIILLIGGPLIVWGMRGHFFSKVSRPISVSEAHQYVNEASQAGIVMNTPFAILRTSHRTQIHIPEFYDNIEIAEAIYSPVHVPADTVNANKKNVVVLILEGFSQEFVGAMNPGLDDGAFTGFTPFLDSLYHQSLTYENTFANGWSSIDGIPLILAGLPKLFNPYVLSPYSLDETPGIAKEMGKKGYYSAYFHGAENSSLGLQASAKSTGIIDYFGMDQYVADPRFGGKKDYDGTWAIWDEEFMQYFCAEISDMKQPFIAALFSATSHHPFAIPERYKTVFTDEGTTHPIQKCIRYTDNSLRLFFESAKKTQWYANTLFVITADHCYRQITRDDFRNSLGNFRVPILFFDPSGTLPREVRAGIAQQIDIMPTVLSYLGYDQPYIAFGQDLLNTEADQTWAFMFQDYPQYIKGDYVLQLDGFEISAVYNYKTDPTLQTDLKESGDYDHQYISQMERELKAILQVADTRMKNDNLTIKE